MGFPTFCYNQLLVTPTIPTASFDGQTAIITGSNTGLGLETARHIARLGGSKVILAVRNIAAGEVAAKDIERTTGCAPGTCEVWHLDLASARSVLEFAERAKGLERIDTLVLNAAVATKIFRLAEGGYERSVTVNTINHFILALLLLPQLRKTGLDYPDRAAPPHITVLTSQVHAWPEFPQSKDPRGIFVALSDKAAARMDERYPITKLLNVYFTTELVEQTRNDNGEVPVIINMLDTGFCHSELSRENKGIEEFGFNIFKAIFARREEVGARTTVISASAGVETHGKYMVNGLIADEALSERVYNEEGRRIQKQLWEEFTNIAEEVKPGIMKEFRS
ncbi:putative short-chain dehydrogenase/reductase family protein [Aspergillus mulundensis]|uniref:Short-chain dehydrogenase n=1 Tax=Aspergillus mulundensis TaxID=1810919 RepID=A0A3D8QFF7_9EURO|nr:hypothetical protein DSM5745_10856 [Aspergillus mulundensis]RDW60398.1 hypothetical protein DSM5745_10856 [Aspergillus mulundensis]